MTFLESNLRGMTIAIVIMMIKVCWYYSGMQKLASELRELHKASINRRQLA